MNDFELTCDCDCCRFTPTLNIFCCLLFFVPFCEMRSSGDCQLYPNPDNVVHPKVIPYRGAIPGSLHEGKLIEIKGSIPYGADMFAVNLMTGLDQQCDRPLHLSVRFSGRAVVRNTLERAMWGPEERTGPFPFHSGKDFSLIILVDVGCYRIAVDSQHCWEYQHRLPISRVTSILIEGSVKVEKLQFMDEISPAVCPPGPTPSAQICPQPGYISSGTSNLAPVYNPSIPYAYPIYGGLKPGMMVYVSGRPSASPYRFTLNFQAGTSPYPPSDIAFHMDVRFHSHSVVRNSRSNNVWEREETAVSHFPFQPGVHFDMIVRIEADRYMVALNGQHFLEFRHRLHPPSRFDTLYIENDVVVSSIRFA